MVPVAARLLRTWRKGAGKTQGDAAEALGVAQPTWSEYEKGKKTPRTMHALKLAALTEGAVPIESWGQLEDPVDEDSGQHAADTPGTRVVELEEEGRESTPNPDAR